MRFWRRKDVLIMDSRDRDAAMSAAMENAIDSEHLAREFATQATKVIDSPSETELLRGVIASNLALFHQVRSRHYLMEYDRLEKQ